MSYADVHCGSCFIGGGVRYEETCEFIGELDEFIFSVVLLAGFNGKRGVNDWIAGVAAAVGVCIGCHGLMLMMIYEMIDEMMIMN